MKLTDEKIIKALLNGKQIKSNEVNSHGGWCVVLDRTSYNLVFSYRTNRTYKIDLDIHLLMADDWEVIE